MRHSFLNTGSLTQLYFTMDHVNWNAGLHKFLVFLHSSLVKHWLSFLGISHHGCLCSERPWKTEMVRPSGTKAEHASACSQVQHKLVWVDIHVAHSFHTHECRGLENWYTWHCWSCPEWQSWVFCASPESCICYSHPWDWLATISAPKEGRTSDSHHAGQCCACHRMLACYMQPASCCCSSLAFHGSNLRPCYCPAS